MNAILQSLFSLPSFSNDLLKQGIQWKRVPVNALLKYAYAGVFFPLHNPKNSQKNGYKHIDVLLLFPCEGVLLICWLRKTFPLQK